MERKIKPQWRPSFRSPSGSVCQADTSDCHPRHRLHSTNLAQIMHEFACPSRHELTWFLQNMPGQVNTRTSCPQQLLSPLSIVAPRLVFLCLLASGNSVQGPGVAVAVVSAIPLLSRPLMHRTRASSRAGWAASIEMPVERAEMEGSQTDARCRTFMASILFSGLLLERSFQPCCRSVGMMHAPGLRVGRSRRFTALTAWSSDHQAGRLASLRLRGGAAGRASVDAQSPGQYGGETSHSDTERQDDELTREQV